MTPFLAMTDLQKQVETLTQRLESLEQQNADLRDQLASDEPASERERGRFNRRGLLRLGGAAAAVGAGSVLLRPSVAGATTGGMQFGADNDAGTASTGLSSSIDDGGDSTKFVDTLHVANTSTGVNSANARAIFAHMSDPANQGNAIYGRNDGLTDAIVGEVTKNDISANGSGVVGFGINFGGVVGISSGAGPGVGGTSFGTGPGISGATSGAVEAIEAWSDNGATGRALFAHVDNPANSKQVMYALTVGTGNAVLGAISHPTSTASAVKGTTNGVGAAVEGAISHSTSSASSLKGTTNGKGAGVEGTSATGPGGRFAGAVQVLLVPSSHSSHPSSGSRGALFVDHGGRLWFCKGGTSWKQLA
jgi:hypothetical protein